MVITDERRDVLNAACKRHHIEIVKVEKWHDGRWWIQLFLEYHPYPDGSGEYVTGRGNDLSTMYQDMIQYLTHVEDLDMDIFKESGLFDHLVGEMFLNDRGEPVISHVMIDNVTMKGIHDGRGGKKNKPIIHLAGSDKTLVLNKTNARAVAGLYGRKTEGWVGKRVSLSAEHGKWFGKEQWRVIILTDAPPPLPTSDRRNKTERQTEPTQAEIDLLVKEHEAGAPSAVDDLPWDDIFTADEEE